MVKNPVEVKNKRFIISPSEMEVDKHYVFEYEGETYSAVKGKSGKVYVYEVEVESLAKQKQAIKKG